VFHLLRGLRILDLTTIVLGPYATQLLGDLGAEVVKVESPEGDLLRAVRPGRSSRMGAPFLNCNRNKSSIALDLRRPEGRAILHRLIATADVLVHNMRSPTARRLGAGYEDARRIREDIVYCYGQGFDGRGPRGNDPAYDDTVQAASGFAALNASTDGVPRYTPTLLADKVAGLHLALAVLAGVVARERTGEGSCIEVPMFESVLSFLLVELLSGRTFQPPLGPMGYPRLDSPFRKPFPTRDGFVAILPYSGAQWTRFLTLAGHAELASEEWVTDPNRRSENIDRLYALVEATARQRTTAEWLELLRRHDIPCAPVNRVEGLLEEDHLEQVGLFMELAHPTEGRLLAVRSPFHLPGVEPPADRPAPGLGENGREILRGAGFSAGEVDALVQAGVLVLPS